MNNPIRILIELLLYVINASVILKSTGKTKALGIALLLSRLTFLLFILPIFIFWIVSPYILYLVAGFAIIAILIFIKNKSLIARNYAILTIGSIFFRPFIFWGGFILLFFNFYNDKKSLKK